jgi:uncharacterized YccA/Bax inhibitor family protein
MRSGNPALHSKTFEETGGYSGERMTLEGTVHKSFIMLALVMGSAFATWYLYFNKPNVDVVPWVLTGAIGGFVLGLITIFFTKASPVTAPVYAVLQGMFLGGVSASYEAAYAGITLQAVSLTFCIFLALLIAYKTRMVKATENFKLGVVSATLGIFLVYLVDIILRFFGMQMPFLHETGLIGIGISLFIVIIAALNLVLDFDFIEEGARYGAPKYMEWYGAFGLMVTLIWLYLEILRLLAKWYRR